MNKVSLAQAIDRARESIDRLDAYLLLSHILSKPKSYLISWPDHLLSDAELQLFNHWVCERAKGYPLAYITGVKSFWEMDLIVSPDVLIPRPETELLVELALSKSFSGASLLELATGSGAIACALARERPDLKITATDISEKALEVARKNAEKYNLNKIHFIHSDWFSNLASQQFDFILANPPYLAETDPHLSTDIRFEPRQALVSGEEGDEDYVVIIANAAAFLKPGGWLLLEHGAEQGERVRELLGEHGFNEIVTVKDLAGLDRVSAGACHCERSEAIQDRSWIASGLPSQ